MATSPRPPLGPRKPPLNPLCKGRVHETDDYLTVRAANPATGIISPSIFELLRDSPPVSPAETVIHHFVTDGRVDNKENATGEEEAGKQIRPTLRKWSGGVKEWLEELVTNKAETEASGSGNLAVDKAMMSSEAEARLETIDGFGKLDVVGRTQEAQAQLRQWFVKLHGLDKPYPLGSSERCLGQNKDGADKRSMSLPMLRRCPPRRPVSSETDGEDDGSPTRPQFSTQRGARFLRRKGIPKFDPPTEDLEENSPAPAYQSPVINQLRKRPTRFSSICRLPTIRLAPPYQASLPRDQQERRALRFSATPDEELHYASRVVSNPAAADRRNTTDLSAVAAEGIVQIFLLITGILVHGAAFLGKIFQPLNSTVVFDDTASFQERFQGLQKLLLQIARTFLAIYILLCAWRVVLVLLRLLSFVLLPAKVVTQVLGWLAQG